MKRSIYNPNQSNTIPNIIKPTEGGTDVGTAAEVRTLMGLIPVSAVNTANGVAGTDSKGFLLTDNIPSSGISTVAIEGNPVVTLIGTGTFKITNFDSLTEYTITASVGSFKRKNDTITFTPPGSAQVVSLYINGKENLIEVVGTKPNKPIVSTLTGSGSPVLGYIYTNAYSNTYGTGTHLSTDWQIATDINFVNVVRNSTNDTVSKTTWSVNDLALSSQYYIRARHRDNSGNVSNWSDAVLLTTKASYEVSNEESRLSISPNTTYDYFGGSCAMSNDGSRLVVGSDGFDSTYNNQGAVFVFVRNGTTWTLEQKLVASDPALAARFGSSVGINSDGTRVVIGSYGKTSNRGGLYVFSRTNSIWSQEANLNASDGAANHYLGKSVCINTDGTRIASGATAASSGVGAAYVFARSGVSWTQEQKISPSDGANLNSFGTSVSMSGDSSRIVVSSHNKTETTAGQGALYVFSRAGSSWTQDQKLVHNDPASNDNLGKSCVMSLDGLRIIAGAPGKTGVAGVNQGAVYIFKRTGPAWAQESKVTHPDAAASDNFGTSVSVNTDASKVVIGAGNKAGTSGSSQGAAYTYNRANVSWVYDSKFLASSGGIGDSFGNSVCISADSTRIAIGAPNKSIVNSQDGTLYLYL